MLTINFLIEITLALIMVSIGSTIELNEIKEIFKKPKKIIVGLSMQMIFFPIIAIIIALIFPLQPEYKVGIILLAACPGGTLSNYISYLIKADIPLAVGLTSVNSLITIFTIPLFTFISFLVFFHNSVLIKVPFSSIALELFFIVLIPVSIGILLKHKKAEKIKKLELPLKIISSILLLIVFSIKLFVNPSVSVSSATAHLLIPLILLNFLGLFLGYLLSKRFKLKNKSATTVGVEVGLQNTILALLISDVVLKMPLVGYPAIIYATFSFITSLIFAIIVIRRK